MSCVYVSVYTSVYVLCVYISVYVVCICQYICYVYTSVYMLCVYVSVYVVCICQWYSLWSRHAPLPHRVHKFFFYVRVSLPALQIASSVPCFLDSAYMHWYDPAVPLLDIYLEKTIIRNDACTPGRIVVLFTIMKTRKRPDCPSIDEGIRKIWCIYVAVVLVTKSRPALLRPHRLLPARLLRPWDAPGKNTGVCCHSLLQRILPTQG